MMKFVAFFMMIPIVILFVIAIYLISRRPPRINLKLLEGTGQVPHAGRINQLLEKQPKNRQLKRIVNDLNWLLENDYRRDIRVKRIIHQDLRSLGEMIDLKEQVGASDLMTQNAVNQSLDVIATRTHKLRHTRNEAARNEILTLADMIKGNDR